LPGVKWQIEQGERKLMSNDGVNKGRRRLLVGATSAVGAVGAVGVAVPFDGRWISSARISDLRPHHPLTRAARLIDFFKLSMNASKELPRSF
jgi:hypothetical protein